MLLELSVENYAVVDRLRVPFYPGLNLLTGETGSGKSILVGALDLLWGGRASAQVVRSGESAARIAGRFDVSENASAADLLRDAGIEAEDGELLIEREILASGKSRVYVGSRPSTAAILRDLAPHLGDIHGQHDQQQLYLPVAQRDMLDGFARVTPLRNRVRDSFRQWRAATAEFSSLEGNEQERLQQLDIWRFQIGEIQSAGLKLNEDTELDAERHIQQNAGKLLEAAGAAYGALYEDPASAYAALRNAIKKLDEGGRVDTALGEVRKTLDPAVIAIQEASFTLRDYVGKMEADPARLDQIENRLALIERLKRKYGGSVDSILEFAEQLRQKIAGVENRDARLAELRAETELAAAAYASVAEELTAARRQAGVRLARAVEGELGALAMERTVFRVEIEAAEWAEHGADSVRFLVSPNRGEEPKPLEKIASGGEVSRIALALKSCLLELQTPIPVGTRTLVFDEVDTGVGGAAAEGVARRLKRLARTSQVLCVTHLAQVASFADHHFRVEKVEANGRTTTRVSELQAADRRAEIARMISGQKLTADALRHADQLIEMGKD